MPARGRDTRHGEGRGLSAPRRPGKPGHRMASEGRPSVTTGPGRGPTGRALGLAVAAVVLGVLAFTLTRSLRDRVALTRPGEAARVVPAGEGKAEGGAPAPVPSVNPGKPPGPAPE